MSFRHITTTLGLGLLLMVARGEELRIAVSDLMADSLEASIADLAEQNSLEISFSKQGSLPALERLASDELDIAVIVVPEGHAMPDSRYTVYPLAYDVAVLAVNEDNPIGEVSLPQLEGIFGSDGREDYQSWEGLGLSGWTGRSIKTFASEIENSISNELFKFTILKSGGFKRSVSLVDVASAERAISSDVTCIGLLSRKLDSRRIKTLMVSTDNKTPAYGPSPDNVHYGDYPLRLPFYVVFETSNKTRIKPILGYLLSEGCSKLLQSKNFYALPDTVRSQYSFELNMQRED
jgi:phosphate transport system substrate-binding protein